jgi:hypothetical protein
LNMLPSGELEEVGRDKKVMEVLEKL